MRLHVVAILDTMWGDPRALLEGQEYPGQAPRSFKINPNNHSGRRLYSLVGDASLLVTNACRELVNHANTHGKPDPAWLGGNLQYLHELRRIDVLLVCGKVAQAAYAECGYSPPSARVIHTLHPAARTWTKALITDVARQVAVRPG